MTWNWYVGRIYIEPDWYFDVCAFLNSFKHVLCAATELGRIVIIMVDEFYFGFHT